MKQAFEGKSVLVTGAGGSIGSQICRLAYQQNARRLTLVSLTESGLYETRKRLEKEFRRYRDTELVGVLGSCGDVQMMRRHLRDVDVVVHTAAHKHVPICEANPITAIRNNVLATWNLMRAVGSTRVPQMVLISSDKAVNPASIMGATKRAVETIVEWYRRIQVCTRFSVVRFGNVCDSAGSVLPLWREQIAAGGPLTLTDMRCERYFMSIANAVDLIHEVIALEPHQGTFVFDMGQPRKLIDIARQMIEESGKDITIEEIGLRPGEKLTEELHYGGELEQTGVPGVMRVVEHARIMRDLVPVLNKLHDCCKDESQDEAIDILWQLAS